MKRYRMLGLSAILSLFALMALPGCGDKNAAPQGDQNQARIDSLTRENDELNEFIDALAFTIDTITAREAMFISVVNPETGQPATKEQIRQELNFLQELIQEQKDQIAQLVEKIKTNDAEYAQKLQKIIKSYEQQLADKQARIADLEAQLNQKDLDIQQLTSNVQALQTTVEENEQVISNQTEVIQSQDLALNEAYVICGTKKELQQLGVLTSSGLFKKAKLDISKISADKFDKVDIRDFTEMEINGKKPQILSQMPADSYTIEKTGKNDYILRILNPQSFWSVSNFLIIQY